MQTPRRLRCRSSAVAAVEQPIARFIRATGTLTAEEQADVAAETAGRVVATPVERGTRGRRRAPSSSGCRRPKPTRSSRKPRPTPRRSRRGSALGGDGAFDVNDGARGAEREGERSTLARSEFDRIETLLDQRVVSQSEYDQRRTQVEAARQQYESAKNGAAQQYQALQAARARVALARKAVSRHRRARAVHRRRRPAARLGRRLRHQGHEGRRRSSAINPLRVQLTVPEQFVVVGRRRPAGRASRSTPIRGRHVRGHGALRLAGAAGRPARADRRSGRAERRRRAQAGPVRDGAHRAAATDARRARAGRRRADDRRHQPRVRRRRRPASRSAS